MSRAWAAGSTRSWRRLRLAVLTRDGWRCQLAHADGRPCLRRLVTGHPDPRYRATVEHLDPIGEGHPLLAPMDRLVAACAHHNGRGGAAMLNAIRSEPKRGWTW